MDLPLQQKSLDTAFSLFEGKCTQGTGRWEQAHGPNARLPILCGPVQRNNDDMGHGIRTIGGLPTYSEAKLTRPIILPWAPTKLRTT